MASRNDEAVSEYEASVSYPVLSCRLGPADPSFQALSRRLKFTIRRHKFNKNSLCVSSIYNNFVNLGSFSLQT